MINIIMDYDKIADLISGNFTKNDIKLGDWVETCDMLPGIVRSIDLDRDDIDVVYPVQSLKVAPELLRSCCSIHHCGVHKINPEWAIILYCVGEKYLRIFYFEDPKTTYPEELKNKGYDELKTYEGCILKYYIEEILSKYPHYDDSILRKYDPNYTGPIKPIIIT